MKTKNSGVSKSVKLNYPFSLSFMSIYAAKRTKRHDRLLLLRFEHVQQHPQQVKRRANNPHQNFDGQFLPNQRHHYYELSIVSLVVKASIASAIETYKARGWFGLVQQRVLVMRSNDFLQRAK